MREYHKIQSIFKRDAKGNFITEFSTPEFEYLRNNMWVGTEKIDGTNIRIMWDTHKIKIGGKTDKAQIPTFLYDKLNELFTFEKMKKAFPETEVCLYGEGYGAKIQKVGSSYIPDGVDFILFDVKIGNFWLKRGDVDDIAHKLKIKSVRIVFEGNLEKAVNMIRLGFNSTIGKAKAEGLVLEPSCQMLNRQGERIITKIKTKDFNKEALC